MNHLAAIRRTRGYSQRLLARKAGVSFRCVQQLEADGHNWRVGTVARVGHALGLPEGGMDYFCGRFLSIVPDSVEEASLRMHRGGPGTWRVHLFNFVDRLRHTKNPELIARPPIEDLEARIRALLASTVEMLCAELGWDIPSWCRGIPALPRPWFVAGMENLKASALIESPAAYRARNVFVLGNFLDRA